MDPAHRFASMVCGPPPALTLDRACAAMSAAFTGTDRTDEVIETLDSFAAVCESPTLQGVLAVLRPRLTGNREEYYDPRNSFIDEALARGLGLPITLAVVAIEVGRRVGAPLAGVGLPSHFIVRDHGRDLFGDPFNDGALYDRADLERGWRHIVGAGHQFSDLHLRAVGERAILIRMLNNLRSVYVHRGDARALWALSIMRGSFVELVSESAEHAKWMRPWN